MKDLHRNCKTGGVPGQQAYPEGEDAYSEEPGESEDDSTTDGEKSVTPSRKLEKEPDLVQQTCIGQQKNNPVTISRHVESENKTANTTQDENKFFDPGGEQDWCALPSRPLPLSGRA